MMDAIKCPPWTGLRVVCIMLGTFATGSSLLLGQSASPTSGSAPATAKPSVKPSALTPASTALVESSAKSDTPKNMLEERLRRMEEAYRRMEETNKKIQG